MKNTFYRPNEINLDEFRTIVAKMNNDLSDISKGYVRENELKEYIAKLIADQKDLPRNLEMGFWGLDEPENMPSDGRVDFFYMPTYIATGILLVCKLNFPNIAAELPGFNESLLKGLLGSTGRDLQGHGHDCIDGMIKALNVFITAKAHIFVEKFPNDCKEFTKLFKNKIRSCEQAILSGKTQGDWGEDYSIQYTCILQVVNPENFLKIDESQNNREVFLFVYGTLMTNNRKGQMYLDDAKYLGECTLKGYALYDLGCFPGIVEENDNVKGELYAIPMDRLPDIDRYEGEGVLYKRKMVQVYNDNKEIFNALVYIYNKSTAGKVKIDYEFQPWFEGVVSKINNKNHVWYAAYGSNINRPRFMKYIMGCSDKTPPKDEKSIILSHPIYFSNHSSSWESKGVAFFDTQKQGETYGKMYLITEEQLIEIQEQEGKGRNWYNKIAEVGFEDGVPIKTITHTPRHLEEVIPSRSYLDVIEQGIRETYPKLSDEDINVYLMRNYLNLEMINVLKYLREQEHGVTINKICMGLSKGKDWVINVINNLNELGLIKQDDRTIRVGIKWDSDEAIYYTVLNMRASIDRLMK